MVPLLPTNEILTVWNIINFIASVLTIISAIVTIIAACKTKKYAKSITQAYSAESLLIANEKLEQAKELYLKLRTIEFGQLRGASPKRTQEDLSKIESLLDEAEKKTPADKEFLKEAIVECKKTLSECVVNTTEKNKYLFIGTELDNVRKQYQEEIDFERKETIKNLK